MTILSRRTLLMAPLVPGAEVRGEIPPRDDAKGDPEFVRYRDRLRKAIRQKSMKSLMGLVSEDIDMPMSGMNGRVDFVRGWMGSPESWDRIRDTMSFGATRALGGYGVPYFSWPSEFDPMCVVVTSAGAVLRRSPSASAAIVERLRWDVLTVEGEFRPQDGYFQVKTAAGKLGWVLARATRSPMGSGHCSRNGTASGR